MTGVTAAPQINSAQRTRLVTERLDAIRSLAADRAGVLLDKRRDFAWLTLGGLNHVLLATETGAAPILVTPQRAVVLAPINEAHRIADEEVAGLPIEVEALPWHEPDAAGEAARRICGGSVASATDLGRGLDALRSVLSPVEHERMAWLGQLIGAAMAELVGGATEGQTEDEVGGALAERFAAHGVRLPVLLAAADERIERYRHPLPTATPLHQRLMVVVVAERWGLHVAQTSFRELAPLSDEISRRAAGLEQVLDAMREATTVGASLGDVLDSARRAYAATGLAEEWALHHQGGTIGYASRERIVVPGDDTPIRAGMAFAWNPSARGHKLEETLFLDEGGQRHIVAPLS